jgi:hypothetical protein
MAHYPKPIDEAIAQGKAAASRAVTLLAQENINTSGEVAEVDPSMCSMRGMRIHLPLLGTVFHRSGCAHVCRPGPDQPGAVQGVRPVRGLMPLRRHSSAGDSTTTRFLPQIFLIERMAATGGPCLAIKSLKQGETIMSDWEPKIVSLSVQLVQLRCSGSGRCQPDAVSTQHPGHPHPLHRSHESEVRPGRTAERGRRRMGVRVTSRRMPLPGR